MDLPPKHGLRLLLALLVVTAFFAIFVMPFMILRGESTWIRQNTGPLNFEEHYAQINSDIPVWVISTAMFPYGLKEEPLRINRPVYLAVQSIMPRLTNIALRLPDLHQGVRGRINYNVTQFWMLAMNVVFVALALVTFLAWARPRFGAMPAFLAALFFVVSPQTLNSLSKASPEAAGLLISVLSVALFDRWLLRDEPPSWRTIFWVSQAIGLFMLVKGHYHILFFCWLWALSRRRWRVTAGTLALHLIPLLLWMLILKLVGLEYYNHESEVYRQGVWILDYLKAGRVMDIYWVALTSLSQFTQILAVAFTPLEWALALGALLFAADRIGTQNRVLFALLFVSEAAFMVLIARAPFYLVFDLYLFVYPCAAIGLIAVARYLASSVFHRSPGTILPRLVAVVLLVNVLIGWRYHAYTGFAWQPDFGPLIDMIRNLVNDVLHHRLGL